MKNVAQWGASKFVLISKYQQADQIKKIRSAGHVERVGKERKVYRVFSWESPKERDHSEDQGGDVRIESEGS
jgi:hypothetical protein